VKATEQIPLPTIIDESLSHYKHQIADKELQVKFQFDQDKVFQVPYYYTTLIIENIIGNAVKYSHNNSLLQITVGEINNQVVCSIRDEGVGMKATDLTHIYENFFRSDSLNHKHIKGNGLGLSIVKKCADAIDAKIDIESELQKGTTVTISF
jgi:signal transduction histidine kinase